MCPANPWNAVKTNRIRPMPKLDAHTCLRREGARVAIGERPHAERRRRLDAHEREHVGQDHDSGPGPADRGRPGRDELDDPRDRDVVAVAFLGSLRVEVRELGDAPVERFVASRVGDGDDPDRDDPECEQDALEGVHVGDRPQSSRRHVDEHDGREKPHAHVDAQRSRPVSTLNRNPDARSCTPRYGTENTRATITTSTRITSWRK